MKNPISKTYLLKKFFGKNFFRLGRNYFRTGDIKRKLAWLSVIMFFCLITFAEHENIVFDMSVIEPNSIEHEKAENGKEIAAKPKEQGDEKKTEFEIRMEKTVSCDFRNTPMVDVLRILAEQVDVDVITSPKVEGAVSAKLTDVPLGEALDNILAAHNYGYITTKNIIRVAPQSEINQQNERLVNRVYRVIYADVKEVESALKKFVSSRGSISASPSSSNIIVNDTESRVKAIDQFITEIDRVIPQILVEVRIYDVTSTDNFDMDVAWNIGLNNTEHGNVSEPDSTGLGIPDTATKTRTSFPYGASSFDQIEGGSIRLGFINDVMDLDIALSILHKEIGAKLLANPKIMVLDNDTANFEIVREIPYQELTQTSVGQTSTIKFKNVGVMLRVTPHITRDGLVRLHIMPEFGVVVGQVTENNPPTVDTRRVDTTALVKDQETVVIGGLKKEETSQTVEKIPLLGDLPLIGAAFRGQNEEVVTTELLVFITPKIVLEPVLSPEELKKFEGTEVPDPAQEELWLEESGSAKTNNSLRKNLR